MSILFKIIFFFILFYTIYSSTLKNGDKLSLILYEYSKEISKIILKIKNKKITINENFTSRFAYIEDQNFEDKEIFNYYSKFINNIWFFFSNNVETINKLLQIDYNDYNITLNGILVPKNINYKLPDKDYNEKIPVFEIGNNYTDFIKKLDIRHTNKNIYLTTKIIDNIEYYPENYLFILSLLILVFGLIIAFLWNKLRKSINRVYILFLHKLLEILIYFHFMLSIFVVIKSFLIRGTKINEYYDDEYSFYIDIFLYILNGTYKYLLWLFVFLLSTGLNITINKLKRNHIRLYLIMSFVLFLLLCTDQFVDILIDKIFRLYGSEIKNIISYIIILILNLKYIHKNINFLKRKYYQASLILPQYKDALFFKLKLFKQLKIILYGYFTIYLLIIILQKTIFYKYDEPIVGLFNYLFIDVIFEILLLIIFRPQSLPNYFNIDMGNLFDDSDDGDIYLYKCPKYEKSHLIKSLNEKQIDLCKNSEIPIIVIGPNNINLNIIMNNVQNNASNIKTNEINKFFMNISIGYFDSI